MAILVVFSVFLFTPFLSSGQAGTTKPGEKQAEKRGTIKASLSLKGVPREESAIQAYLQKNWVNETLDQQVVIPTNALSPNKKTVVVLKVWRPVPNVNRRATLYFLNLETSKFLNVHWCDTCGTNISGIAWSRDGKQAVLSMHIGLGWGGGLASFRVLPAKAELIFSLNREIHSESFFSPSFSPDEKKILFSAIVHKPIGEGAASWASVVFAVDRGGKNIRKLSIENRKAWAPEWYDEGRLVLYVVAETKYAMPEELERVESGQVWAAFPDGSECFPVGQGTSVSEILKDAGARMYLQEKLKKSEKK